MVVHIKIAPPYLGVGSTSLQLLLYRLKSRNLDDKYLYAKLLIIESTQRLNYSAIKSNLKFYHENNWFAVI